MARLDRADFEWAVVQPLLPIKPQGGLTTIIHALVDGVGNLITFKITEGQAYVGHGAFG